MNAVKVIIIAHNQYNVIRVQLEALFKITDFSGGNIIIVDNYSDDGLKEWLVQQNDIDYILCDEKLETYADILNVVMREFVSTEDILLLNPGLLLLPETMRELQTALYSDEKVGAVYPMKMQQDENEEWSTIKKAIDYAEQRKNSRKYSEEMGLPTQGVLVANKMLRSIGEIDGKLILPRNVMTDISLRGILEGYKYIEVKNAYLYQIISSSCIYEEIYGADVDRVRMKEKWGMNYFNEMPNPDILVNIQEKQDIDMNVLEIGCDCGANLLHIKNRFYNAKLYGIEINPDAARIAGCFAKVRVGNIEEGVPDFEDIKFDYIIFGDVLEHLKDPAKTLAECKKILKSSGKIIASIPNLMHYSVIYDLLNGNFQYTDMGLLDRTHIHFFTYNEILKMFHEEGYRIEKISYVEGEDYQKAEQDFVHKLLEISNAAEEFMFVAFQYIVVAVSGEI